MELSVCTPQPHVEVVGYCSARMSADSQLQINQGGICAFFQVAEEAQY